MTSDSFACNFFHERLLWRWVTVGCFYRRHLASKWERKDKDKTRAMANPKIFQTMESQEANVFVKNVCTVSNSQNQEENEFISSPCLTDFFTSFSKSLGFLFSDDFFWQLYQFVLTFISEKSIVLWQLTQIKNINFMFYFNN